MAMKMAPGDNPRPGRVAEQDQSVPWNLSAMAAELCIVSGKILRGLGFFRRKQLLAIGRREGVSEGHPRVAAAAPLRPAGGTRPYSVGPSRGRPSGSGPYFLNEKSS